MIGTIAVVAATVLVPLAQVVDGQTVVPLQVFPLEGPCRFYRNFGDYRSPTRTHEGEDIAPVADADGWKVEPGHDVYAALPGTVKQVWFDSGSTSGAGNGVQLTHAGGTSTRYYHLGSLAPGITTVGATVAAGQVLGTAGDTGTSDGNYHLHFELHPGGGAAIDPVPSLEALGGCGVTPAPVPAPAPAPPPAPPEPTPSAVVPVSTPIMVPDGVAGFMPVAPTRRLDTRVDDVDADGRPEMLTGRGVARVSFDGIVPETATAVAVNVTATGPEADGYLTAYPCGPTAPTTSSLNYRAGEVVPGAVIVGIGEARSICVTSYAPSNVVVDLAGWFESSAGASFTAITPVRALDTRTADDPLPDSVLRLELATLGLVPRDATAVALNVTAADPAADGWVSAWPCGQPEPPTSNVNPSAGVDVANLVNVGVGPDATVCFRAFRATELVVDVLGWYAPGAGGQLTPVAPTRVADTRTELAGERLTAGGRLRLDLRTQALLPPDVSAVQATITVADPAAAGFVTAYPCGPLPTASNLNYTSDAIVANSAQVTLGAEGQLCVYSLAATDVIVDITGVWRTV